MYLLLMIFLFVEGGTKTQVSFLMMELYYFYIDYFQAGHVNACFTMIGLVSGNVIVLAIKAFGLKTPILDMVNIR